MFRTLNIREVRDFHQDGFVVVPGLFTPKEVTTLRAVCARDPRLKESHGRGGARAENRRSELWSIPVRHAQPDPDYPSNRDLAYDAFCYSERMIRAHEALLLDPQVWPDDAISLHHRKFVLKDRESFHPPEADQTGKHGGNGFQWHQDYWYWGDYTTTGSDAYGGPGRPYPHLAISLVALDHCHRGNGCLQVLRGSHKHRVEFRAEQWGERHALNDEVDRLLAAGHAPVWVELTPGDAVFFSCETLHRSFPNGTDEPRWVFICCYDTMHNVPNGIEDWRQPAPVWPDKQLSEFVARHHAHLEGQKP